MTPSDVSAVSPAGVRARWNGIVSVLERAVPEDVLLLAARVAIAAVFFLSGRTKVDGWLNVSDNAVALFADEYRLPLISPEVAAHLAAYAEHLFPVLLVLGLGTRAAALALLAMTAVIQVFVYPAAWPTHLTWAVALLLLLGRGGGSVSADRALGIA